MIGPSGAEEQPDAGQGLASAATKPFSFLSPEQVTNDRPVSLPDDTGRARARSPTCTCTLYCWHHQSASDKPVFTFLESGGHLLAQILDRVLM